MTLKSFFLTLNLRLAFLHYIIGPGEFASGPTSTRKLDYEMLPISNDSAEQCIGRCTIELEYISLDQIPARGSGMHAPRPVRQFGMRILPPRVQTRIHRVRRVFPAEFEDDNTIAESAKTTAISFVSRAA